MDRQTYEQTNGEIDKQSDTVPSSTHNDILHIVNGELQKEMDRQTYEQTNR